jgi:hypothetical protein
MRSFRVARDVTVALWPFHLIAETNRSDSQKNLQNRLLVTPLFAAVSVVFAILGNRRRCGIAYDQDVRGATQRTGKCRRAHTLRFSGPNVLATDISSNIYVTYADNNTIHKAAMTRADLTTQATRHHFAFRSDHSDAQRNDDKRSEWCMQRFVVHGDPTT